MFSRRVALDIEYLEITFGARDMSAAFATTLQQHSVGLCNHDRSIRTASSAKSGSPHPQSHRSRSSPWPDNHLMPLHKSPKQVANLSCRRGRAANNPAL